MSNTIEKDLELKNDVNTKHFNRISDYEKNNKYYKNIYLKNVANIKNCKDLTNDEKQLLIDQIPLPINHMVDYEPEDDIYNNLLSEEDKQKYGIS